MSLTSPASAVTADSSPIPGPRDRVTVGEVTRTLAEWAEHLDYNVNALRQRIRRIGLIPALTHPKPSNSARGRQGAKTWRRLVHASAQQHQKKRNSGER